MDEDFEMKKNYVIAIAREKGSGGTRIAKELSERLGIPYYDRDLLRRASDVSGINEKLFGAADERIGFREMMSAAEKVYNGEILPPDSNDYVSTRNLFSFQAKVIKEMAQTESCIIIGRCADYLLSDKDNVLRVFIHAPVEYRRERVKHNNLGMSDREINKRIRDCDKRRSEYYHYYTGDDWKDVTHEDISLDSYRYGIDGCVDRIIAAIPLFLGIEVEDKGK